MEFSDRVQMVPGSLAAVVVLASLMTAPTAIGAPAAEAPSTTAPASPATSGVAPRHGKPGVKKWSGAHDATVHHPFDDVKKWTGVFDDPKRDEWQKPNELVGALRLHSGDRVADLGAGTGYFAKTLSAAVGPTGTVFAVEVEPKFVEHLRARAEKEGTANVVPVLASFDNPRLPAGVMDLVLIVDTYHHFDDRLRYFRDLRRSLAPGGRVAIVDFRKKPLPVGPGLEHKLDRAFVIDEMLQSGYRLAEDLDELLPYQYVLIFAPVADPAASAPTSAGTVH